jgi:hypothetical protein
MKIAPNLQSGHMDVDGFEPPAWFKVVLWLAILGLLLLVARCSPSVHAQTNLPPAGWATNIPPRKAITDLGVITPDSIINLEKCERRKDFFRFRVEILPRNARGWTNKVQFYTTNDFLKIDDLAAVPDGVAIMGVRSYCANGDASPVALFRIDVQRDPPDAPKATKAQILRMPSEQVIEHVIESLEPPPGPLPPMPAGMTNKSAVPLRSYVEPLPNGTNSSYAQWQHRLEQAAMRGLRRSQ